ncbi:FAD-dependent oxidoreductase [Mycolicibacterium aubagnense]
MLFGAEDRLPYERPPLSKEFMAGKKTIEAFTVQPKSWYAEHDVDLRLGTEVTTLDRTARTVAFNDGDHEHYDKLSLATRFRSRETADPRISTPTASTSCAPSTTQPSCSDNSAPAGGWRSSAAAGSGSRSRPVPADWAPTSRSWNSAALPLLASLGREAGEVFVGLTVITASICG